jgi:ribose transport system ATP-binding protein
MKLDNAPYRPNGPHAARLAGVAMIYQELNLAPDLSVEDNIMLGVEQSRFGVLRRNAQRKKVHEALERLGHSELNPKTIVGQMSIGAQQLVEIARAMVMNARVIIFDEPTSSLPKRDVEQLFEVIKQLRSDGRAIVYISHFLEEVRTVADRYSVLRDGEIAGHGVLDETVTDRDIVTLMVGRSVEELFPQVPHHPSETILELDALCGDEIPKDISIKLRRGEILGISGLVGAGRTELLRCLFGLDKIQSGEISIAGQPTSRRLNPRRQIANGLGLVSEDRKTEGLAQSLSITDNMILSRLQPYTTAGWIHDRRVAGGVEHWMQELSIKASSADQNVEALSGGNQQKVAIARILHQEADILLLDEPTRGIDVGTKSQIYELIGRAASEGKAIVFVSSYLPELMAMCDRIAVMSRGKIQAIRDTAAWTDEDIMSFAINLEVND